MTIRLPTSTMSTSAEQHQHQVRLAPCVNTSRQQVEQLHEELDAERDQRERHAEVDGRQDPAAGEQQLLDRSFHPWAWIKPQPRRVFFRAACARRRPRRRGKSGNASRKRSHSRSASAILPARRRSRISSSHFVGIGLLRVGVGGRPRLTAECRPGDRVARTGSAPRVRRCRAPVTRLPARCRSTESALADESAACRAIDFLSGRGGSRCASAGGPAARLRAAPRAESIAAESTATDVAANDCSRAACASTRTSSTTASGCPRASPLPWRGSPAAAPPARGRRREASPQAPERTARSAPVGATAQTSPGACARSSQRLWRTFAHGLDRERRVVLHAALDHDGHDQHDRSSERDRRAPAQPRARACRAAARDSSARLRRARDDRARAARRRGRARGSAAKCRSPLSGTRPAP